MMLPLMDVFGQTKEFRFRYWVNNNSRMYLIESTQSLLTMFKLGVGDVLMFGKDTSNTVYVCGRKRTEGDVCRKSVAKQKKKTATPQLELYRTSTTRKTASRARTNVMPKDTGEGHALGDIFNVKQDSEVVRNDGVFRAVPSNHPSVASSSTKGQISLQNGFWCATIHLEGEDFHAFFDTKDAATAAFLAAQQTT